MSRGIEGRRGRVAATVLAAGLAACGTTACGPKPETLEDYSGPRNQAVEPKQDAVEGLIGKGLGGLTDTLMGGEPTLRGQVTALALSFFAAAGIGLYVRNSQQAGGRRRRPGR